jgi:hypothetical protein
MVTRYTFRLAKISPAGVFPIDPRSSAVISFFLDGQSTIR